MLPDRHIGDARIRPSMRTETMRILVHARINSAGV